MSKPMDEKYGKRALFDHLNDLTLGKPEWDKYDDRRIKTYDPYIINRFVSMVKMFVPLINKINRSELSKEDHYNFLSGSLPKRKQYFKYIGKKADNNKEARECIIKYFNIGPRQVDEYLDILTTEQAQEIVKKYDHGRV